MSVYYFNISNGQCVPAFTDLPQYRATIVGYSVIQIEACFSIGNIIQHGMEWFQKQVENDYNMWEEVHPHLMKSLKELIVNELNSGELKHFNFQPSCHRFPYVLVWDRDKIYDPSYFKNKWEV